VPPELSQVLRPALFFLQRFDQTKPCDDALPVWAEFPIPSENLIVKTLDRKEQRLISLKFYAAERNGQSAWIATF
jgi:hypothetical protein